MRLTADLINRSPQVINAIKERELVLRGNKIPAIENLGATQDQFESIDVSDNDVKKLDSFPRLPRLKTLLACNNRIARIGSNLGDSLPHLETLILTNNQLVNLADLDPLSSLTKLLRLSLLENPVTRRPNYRLYVISKVPSVKLLDFARVKLKERDAAKRMFGSTSANKTENEDSPVKPRTFVPGEPAPRSAHVGPTPEQVAAIKLAIQNATSLEEVMRLEKALKSGNIPADLQKGKVEMVNGSSSLPNPPQTDPIPPPQGTDEQEKETDSEQDRPVNDMQQ